MKQILFLALMMAILGFSAGCGDGKGTAPKGMGAGTGPVGSAPMAPTKIP